MASMTNKVYDTKVEGTTKGSVLTGILNTMSEQIIETQEYIFTITIAAVREDPVM